MGDKIAAKEAWPPRACRSSPARTARSTSTAREVAAEVGFPMLLKASAGGGGRGMRLVESAGELEAAFRTASRGAVGLRDGSLYVEKAVVGPATSRSRCSATARAAVLTLGERDCSIQRRHQKLVEESPSPAVTAGDPRRDGGRGASARAQALRYRGAGTIEFLLDAEGRFYFIEMNTRLQVEHPVTELVTGIDLAHAQLAVAAGEGLPLEGARACEATRSSSGSTRRTRRRASARRPAASPASEPPLGPGVRVDTHVEEGYAMPPFYDSLIAKVIVWGEDREVAIARGRRALSELELEGVPTTRELALDIVSSEEFGSGDYTTSFLADAAPSLESLRGGAA